MIVPKITVPRTKRHKMCFPESWPYISASDGGGGTRAARATIAKMVAMAFAGLRFNMVGGVSGGGIVPALIAGGMSTAEVVKVGLDLDFSTLVTKTGWQLKGLFRHVFFKRSDNGIFDISGVGRFVEERVGSAIPDNYWTVAMSGDEMLVITAAGVHSISRNGQIKYLTSTAPPLGTAIMASCAVPGFIKPQIIAGRVASDGGYSWEGVAPVTPLLAMGIPMSEIVVTDVGPDTDLQSWIAGELRKAFVGDNGRSSYVIPQGLHLAEPRFTGSWQDFTLTLDQKLQPIMAAFYLFCEKFVEWGLMSADKLPEAKVLSTDPVAFRQFAESQS